MFFKSLDTFARYQKGIDMRRLISCKAQWHADDDISEI
jgi:hypothetical protein